ncbi:HEAT repeat domain-containing protein [Novipirellula sp.]|uniref:HEAT repeat domain-containing protein n=1 Tax=Novipirellula sp. TaxID=2795430 RepID=UPI0035633E55
MTSLFQDVESVDVPAYDILYDAGLPQLIRIFDGCVANVKKDNASVLLLILKILALYGSEAGAERIVQSSRHPVLCEGYLWHPILSVFTKAHPHRDYVFAKLGEALPVGFLAVALLDAANGVAIESNLDHHPFDNPEGHRRLQAWLEDRNPDHFSYAHSATAALPFVDNPTRDQLLALAMDHVDEGVQMEAAWASGRMGRESGLKVLARYCLDVNHSDTAKRYLAELGREDLIPDDANDSDFQAKAEMAQWLAHPNELGRAPDELEIIDQRELAWPPEGQPRPFWLVRYMLKDRTGLEKDDIGCGLVGSMTWCFFMSDTHRRPPEDIYAIHCFWEMEHSGLIVDNEVTEPGEYASVLGSCDLSSYNEVKIVRVAELSANLQFPHRVIALATANRHGQTGWLAIHGGKSAWYDASEQPEGTSDSLVMKIHVGRRLLGFQGQPDRKKHLATTTSERTPDEIIAAYGQLLDTFESGSAEEVNELLSNRSLLPRHFSAYIDAAAKTKNINHALFFIELYERFLEVSRRLAPELQAKAYDSFNVLCQNFNEYVSLLISHNRREQVAGLIDLLTDHWQHNLGYGRLGTAAFDSGDFATAEKFFEKLRDGLESYYRSAEMSCLAEIWHSRGETQRAKALLLECLQKTLQEIQQSKYNSDKQMFADEYRRHRTTFLRLFPGTDSELLDAGVPDSPL